MRYNIVQAVDHLLLQPKVMIVTHISVYLMITMRISNSQPIHLKILKT